MRDYNGGAVIGFSQVIMHLGDFARELRFCGEDIVRFSPDAVILIDYPGFNFRVAEFAHKKGFRVFYYIAPKVWASREGRIRKLKAFVDKLFIVFPFEQEYFTRKGVDWIYKGNPLIDAIDSDPGMQMTREEFFRRNNLEDRRFVVILAGSRKGEVSCMMPVCTAFADSLRSTPGYEDMQFIIAGAPSRRAEDYSPYLEGRRDYMRVIFGQTYPLMRFACAAVVNSGTASLETALAGTPQVACYSGSDFNFNVAKNIIKIEYISLGNLILGRKAFRELLQYHFTPENLTDEVIRLISDEGYRARMKEDYAEIRRRLGGSGASEAVARAMLEELRSKEA